MLPLLFLKVQLILVVVDVQSLLASATVPTTDQSYRNYADEEILICAPRGICQCDDRKVSCDNVTWIDYTNERRANKRLQTANVLSKAKAFVVEKAFFRFNDIEKLEKGKILPGHEASINELDFSHNRISTIGESAFDKMDNLEILRLGWNVLRVLGRSSFAGGPNWSLRELDLSYNQLSDISDEIFEEMPYLETLILDGNRLLSVSKRTFGPHLSKVTTLSMNDCNFTDFNENLFDELINLEQLFIRQNPIVEIPHAVHDLPSLRTLDMSYTNITEIEPYAFVFDRKLRTLRLQGLHYLYIIHSCAFCGLDSLKELLLTNATELYMIDEDAFGRLQRPALQTLDLEYANLTSLARDMLDYSELKCLKLGGNPWNCSCELSWLYEYDIDLGSGSTAPVCRTPNRLRDVKLNSTMARRHTCSSTGHKRIMFSFLMVLLVSLIGLLYYTSARNDRFRKLHRDFLKRKNMAYTILKEDGDMKAMMKLKNDGIFDQCTTKL